MDIRIDADTGNFKVRACGIISQGDRYLIVRMGHNSFFCCPGGHIEVGETSMSAVIREIREEAGIETTIDRPLALMENFYKNSKGNDFHELSFYYMLSPVSLEGKENDFELLENDKGYLVKQEFKWVTLEELKNIDFRPVAIKDKLIKGDLTFQLLLSRE